jgi:uncharacterized membrane protein
VTGIVEKKQDELRQDALNGGLCYAFGVLFPLVYLLSVRRNKQHPFIRFHCIQCLILFAVMTPLYFLSAGWMRNVSDVLSPILVVVFLVALIQAGRRKMFRIPGLGQIAEWLAVRGKPVRS